MKPEGHGSTTGLLLRLMVVAATGCAILAFTPQPLLAATTAQPTLDPSLLPHIEAATFEVVAAKPNNTLIYAEPLPLDLLPFQKRNDKYHSIGTAFEIGPNRFVTAGHVLMVGNQSLWGPLKLRSAKGKVFSIDKIEKFAFRRDFVVFSLKDPPKVAPLPTDAHPTLNEAVYTVGNALGRGVVIRSGLYTSETPESQSGKWDWMSFSAAASPGNSGGPLIDQNGNVIGIVLKGVPGQNLNYALPISQVLDAPKDTARFNKRMPYHLPVSSTTYISTFNDSFTLPKTVPEFFTAFDSAFEAYFASQMAGAAKQQSAQLFPHGTGSLDVFNGNPPGRSFPHLLERNGDDIWIMKGKPMGRVPLPANGYLTWGKASGTTMFHLRLPDTTSVSSVDQDPKELMDLVLRTGFVTRTIAGDKVKVMSLGSPAESDAWTDEWGRRWHIWVWPVPFINAYQILAVLPQPGGDALLAQLVPAAGLPEGINVFKELTDFTSVSYFGTLAQWKAFLRDSKLLPTAFNAIHIAFNHGKGFTYRSPSLDFAAPESLQHIKPDSMLWLGFNFYPPDRTGKVVWGVSEITLYTHHDSFHGFEIIREPRPPVGIGEPYQVVWNEMTQQQHPFDGQAFSRGGATLIYGVVPPKTADTGTPSVLYGAFVSQPGEQPQAKVKKQLALLLGSVKVNGQ